MYFYNQSSGYLSRNGTLVGQGYSGHGDGVNNPDMESVSEVGPIPRGDWIFGHPVDHPQLGPLAIPIQPKSGTKTYGRGGFFCHGDEVGHVGEEIASHGCIIMSRTVRQYIIDNDDPDLEVV